MIESAPGGGELLHAPLRALDHQMDVEHPAATVHLLAQRVDHERADRDRRHEVPVHHVHVDHARAGVHHLGHLIPEPSEVGGEDRGSHAHVVQDLRAHRRGEATGDRARRARRRLRAAPDTPPGSRDRGDSPASLSPRRRRRTAPRRGSRDRPRPGRARSPARAHALAVVVHLVVLVGEHAVAPVAAVDPVHLAVADAEAVGAVLAVAARPRRGRRARSRRSATAPRARRRRRRRRSWSAPRLAKIRSAPPPPVWTSSLFAAGHPVAAGAAGDRGRCPAPPCSRSQRPRKKLRPVAAEHLVVAGAAVHAVAALAAAQHVVAGVAGDQVVPAVAVARRRCRRCRGAGRRACPGAPPPPRITSSPGPPRTRSRPGRASTRSSPSRGTISAGPGGHAVVPALGGDPVGAVDRRGCSGRRLRRRWPPRPAPAGTTSIASANARPAMGALLR